MRAVASSPRVGRCVCQKSFNIMPATMAKTKTITRGDDVARFSSAGPGHNPTNPQPTPNSAEPASNGRSMSAFVGHWLCGAKSGARSLTTAKPMPDTARAAAITTARLGSHAPNRSRKLSTLVGCVMPDIKRPKPKMKPQTKPASDSISASNHVTRERDDHDGRAHKDGCRHDRAGR